MLVWDVSPGPRTVADPATLVSLGVVENGKIVLQSFYAWYPVGPRLRPQHRLPWNHRASQPPPHLVRLCCPTFAR